MSACQNDAQAAVIAALVAAAPRLPEAAVTLLHGAGFDQVIGQNPTGREGSRS